MVQICSVKPRIEMTSSITGNDVSYIINKEKNTVYLNHLNSD